MVEEYTDFRLFVDDALNAMGYTRGSLADQLGISRSMMSHVLNRRRQMNPIHIDEMARYFHLDEDGRILLSAMVDLDNESKRARRAAWATLQAHQRYKASYRPSVDVLKVLSSWWMCAIYDLASMPGFHADPHWIARVIRPRIEPHMAQEGLQALLAAGMLRVSDGGGLEQVHDVAWTTSELPAGEQSDAVWKLLRGVLEQASTARSRSTSEIRQQSTAVFAVPMSRLPRLLARLRELEREVFHMATSECSEAERLEPQMVFACSNHFFPLTGAVSPGTSADEDPPLVSGELPPPRRML